MGCFFLTFASASARGAVGLKAQGQEVGAGPCKGAVAPSKGLQGYFQNKFGKAEMVPTFAFPNRTGKRTDGEGQGKRGRRAPGPEAQKGTMPHGSAGNDDKCRTVRGRRESSFKIYNM